MARIGHDKTQSNKPVLDHLQEVQDAGCRATRMQQVGINNLSVRLRVPMDGGALKRRSKRHTYLPRLLHSHGGSLPVRLLSGSDRYLTCPYCGCVGKAWNGSLARLTRRGMTSSPKVLQYFKVSEVVAWVRWS